MTAADVAPTAPPRPTPPTPEECEHPAPMLGVMAHEFSPYRGALGPEGKRRTTMHYGPIVGGLPISAWHCELCGLLKLDYPDGRKEERRLFPGPQPDLIRVAVAEAATVEAVSGRQARVSGLSVPARVYRLLAPEPPPRDISLPTISVPSLDEAVDWLVVAGIGATMLGLCIVGVGAVYDWRTASWVGPLAAVTGAVFGGSVLLKIVAAAFKHFVPWPRLAPSPAAALGGKPKLDGIAWTIVATLIALIVGLTVAGILAVYDWKTPDIEKPLVFALIGLFVLGTVLVAAGGAVRALAAGRGPSTSADLD